MMNCLKAVLQIRRWISTDDSYAVAFDRHVIPRLRCLLDSGFSLAECRVVIQRYPTILQLSIDNQIQPVLTTLEEGIATEASSVGRCPLDVREAIVQHPVILGSALSTILNPNLQFWKREMEMRPHHIQELFVRSPPLICRSPEIMRSHMFFFHNRFAQTHEMVSIFGDFPDVLNVPMDDLVRFHAFWKEAGMSDRDFVEMIVKHPTLLRLSWNGILQPMMQYMIFICRHRQGALLFVQDPTFFEMSLDELSSRVEYLLELGLTRRQVTTIVKKQPEILKTDLVTMQQRTEALKTVEGLTGRRLLILLAQHPELLMAAHASPCRTDPVPAASFHATSCPLI